MILHLVTAKPRAGLTAVEREAFRRALERALNEIPSVRGYCVGQRVTHGAEYESQMPDAADFLALIEFEDLAGLQAYLAHPAHQELGRLFGDLLTQSLVYDFRLASLDALA